MCKQSLETFTFLFIVLFNIIGIFIKKIRLHKIHKYIIRFASFTKYYYYQLNVYKFTRDFFNNFILFKIHVSSYLSIKEMKQIAIQ